MLRNLVDLISIHDPSGLDALRLRFPNAGPLLRWDKPLGVTNAATVSGDTAARRELAETGAKTLRLRTEAIIAGLSGRLRRARRLRAAGAALAAATNAGLIASLAKATSANAPHIELALAIVGFVASLLVIFAESATGGPAGGQVAQLFDTTVELSTRLLQADLHRARLCLTTGTDVEWDNLLSELDAVALAVHQIELKAAIN